MEDRIGKILAESRTVAVVGISGKPDRPSHVVAKYLRDRGFQVIPVNPTIDEVLGEKSYRSLSEIPGKVDLVTSSANPWAFPRTPWRRSGSGRAFSGCRKACRASRPGNSRPSRAWAVKPAVKVNEEIASVRGIKAGERAISPARFPDISNLEELHQRIIDLRNRYPDKAIGVKIVANDIEADVEAALSLEPDFITIDGFGGGTGSAPGTIRDHFGMPLVMALPVVPPKLASNFSVYMPAGAVLVMVRACRVVPPSR